MRLRVWGDRESKSYKLEEGLEHQWVHGLGFMEFTRVPCHIKHGRRVHRGPSMSMLLALTVCDTLRPPKPLKPGTLSCFVEV